MLSQAAGSEPPPEAAFAPVTLHSLPASAVRMCKSAQKQSPHPILCPRRLPRPTLPWPDGTRREFRVHVWPQGLYWANHTWFAWRERGVRYLASVHYFGPEETLTLLARLVRELRPV